MININKTFIFLFKLNFFAIYKVVSLDNYESTKIVFE